MPHCKKEKYTEQKVPSWNVVPSPSRLKNIRSEWNTKDFHYTSFMYFNEAEMLRVFDEAYGEDRTQKGELKIKVSKDCKSFDLSLNVGGKSIKLEKTEIRVFQDPIDKPDGDGTLIYKIMKVIIVIYSLMIKNIFRNRLYPLSMQVLENCVPEKLIDSQVVKNRWLKLREELKNEI